MATIIEFDQRYFTERSALAEIPHMGVPGFRIAVHPGTHRNPSTGEWEPRDEYRLQLLTDRPVPVLKQLKRLHPVRTFRVVQL